VRKNPEIPRDFFGGGSEEALETPPPRRPGPVADEGKVQVTIYLSEPAALALEKMRYALMLEYGIKATKSAIAQYAIETAGRDIEGLARGVGRRGE
jgi:hypothetical protein